MRVGIDRSSINLIFIQNHENRKKDRKGCYSVNLTN